MRFAAFAALLFGCGRLNFNEQPSLDADVDSPLADAATIAVCGNGICEGELGEMCGMCGGDCAVTAVVCGNGECQTGEDGTTCYADCGPATWPWTQEETDLLNAVNAARTGGVTCPGDAMARTAPAYVATTTMTTGAREMAWERVHQLFSSGNGTSCNGRSFAAREQTYGGTGGITVSGNVANAATAVSVWKSDSTLCPILMSAKTQATTAVAHDNGLDAWILWIK